MGMKLDQLLAFEAVVRLGTFTRAAEELYLTQPTLSRQIAALERELGAPLLQRLPAGPVLTPAGEVLLPIARRMLADAEGARREVDELAGLRRGRVVLGAPPTLCVSVVADVLATFRAAHPGIELVVAEAGSRSLMERLQEGGLDLALVVTRGDTSTPAGIELVPLLSEELVVVSSAAHGFPDGPAGKPAPRSVSLSRLSRLPLVGFNRSYDLRLAIDAALASAGLVQTMAVEGAEMDAVLRFVERGIGVALVPAMVVADRPGLVSTRLVHPSLERTVNLARREQAAPTAAAAALQAEVFATAARLTAPGTALAKLVTPVSAG